jgi:DNA-binding response OmpR family regulator
MKTASIVISESESMASAGDRILLIEDDPEISDLIARQTLIPVGYSVDVAIDSTAAIKQALLTPPDLIIADLNLPGLSAKDLLVAFAAQGIRTPLLVVAHKGQEQDIIQAFRLGAADYLLWPARDAEVLAAVERVLSHVHEMRDRQRLDAQLGEVTRQLQRRNHELAVLASLGNAVVSTADQRSLFAKIVETAIQASDANIAWLLVREEESKQFLLVAHKGLPQAWAKKMDMPLDDGISGLVALSGETLSIAGEPLQRFRVANLGKAACVVPIKVHKEVIGLLVVVRKALRPFEKMEQMPLEAIADYASMSLLNARLFRALNDSAQASRGKGRQPGSLSEASRSSMSKEVRSALQQIETLLAETPFSLSEAQRASLQTVRVALQRLSDLIQKTEPSATVSPKKK